MFLCLSLCASWCIGHTKGWSSWWGRRTREAVNTESACKSDMFDDAYPSMHLIKILIINSAIKELGSLVCGIGIGTEKEWNMIMFIGISQVEYNLYNNNYR